MKTNGIVAIAFDVFGSVVDWRTSLIDDISAYALEQGIELDVPLLVDDWRQAYQPSLGEIREGRKSWALLDDIHRATLDRLLAAQGVTGLSEGQTDHINTGWHRLKPWPDSAEGLQRLVDAGYQVVTLSNGNRQLLEDMAEFSGLPWTRILSAEDFRHYKPDAEVYLGAARKLNCEPHELMLGAAHNMDLRGAANRGLKTAFWPRRTEYGPRQRPDDLAATGPWDIVVDNIIDLADALT